MIGGLLGILLAAAVVLIVYLTNDTVKTPEDVEKYLGLSVLGTIPYSSKMGKKSKRKRNVTHKITTTDQSVGKGREQQKYEEIFVFY